MNLYEIEQTISKSVQELKIEEGYICRLITTEGIEINYCALLDEAYSRVYLIKATREATISFSNLRCLPHWLSCDRILLPSDVEKECHLQIMMVDCSYEDLFLELGEKIRQIANKSEADFLAEIVNFISELEE